MEKRSRFSGFDGLQAYVCELEAKNHQYYETLKKFKAEKHEEPRVTMRTAEMMQAYVCELMFMSPRERGKGEKSICG